MGWGLQVQTIFELRRIEDYFSRRPLACGSYLNNSYSLDLWSIFAYLRPVGVCERAVRSETKCVCRVDPVHTSREALTDTES